MSIRKRYILFNGSIIDLTQACISPLDRGFLLGDGLFETMRSYNGAIPFWDLHMERLKDGMTRLGFPHEGVNPDLILNKTIALLKVNRLKDGYVRFTISRGIQETGPLPEWGKGKTNWMVYVSPLSDQLAMKGQKGIKAIISEIRKNSTSPVARLKTVNYLDLILAKREGFLKGAEEAVLLDEKGRLAECSTSNLFWIKGDILYTPSLQLPILPGITRKHLLGIASNLCIICEEGFYGPSSLMMSDEAFVTNSLCEIIPLTHIDGKEIGTGRPGPVTIKFQAAYRDFLKKIISL